MCGITGFISEESLDKAYSVNILKNMTETLHHRGPNDTGFWCEGERDPFLGHKRLSILDISQAGHQPMESADQRYILVFNGEIYNHFDLRKTLDQSNKSIGWKGSSDTETLLTCLSNWGVTKTLSEVNGMFSFALWDKKERVLTLARDRMGEKPLYYGWLEKTFIFGSEVKALRKHPRFKSEIDRNSLSLLLRHNCIPAPYSIFKGIKKLKPGHLLKISADNFNKARQTESICYWNLKEFISTCQSNRFEGSENEAVDLTESYLKKSIKRQMISDVPLGAFLSGGIDSSTVVALMQEQSSSSIKTFTIGFEESNSNEAEEAKKVAEYLGTDHTEMNLSPKDALAVIPKLPEIYCEPFSDSSQIPTFLVSKLASEKVTVALSGDGGDEIFGGYNRYLLAHSMWSKMKSIPFSIKFLLSLGIRSFSPRNLDKIYNVTKIILPESLQIINAGEKLKKFSEVLDIKDNFSFYQHLSSHWPNPSSVLLNSVEPKTLINRAELMPEIDFIHWMMYMDSQTYLPDDILVKTDRAAMANSLETRIPLLDKDLMELSWSFPLSMKIKNGKGKNLLRKVLSRHIPNELVERPKQGFGIPLGDWLKGPLEDWTESLINKKRIEEEGFFDYNVLSNLWKNHKKGAINAPYHLWDILMFQAWNEIN